MQDLTLGSHRVQSMSNYTHNQCKIALYSITTQITCNNIRPQHSASHQGFSKCYTQSP